MNDLCPQRNQSVSLCDALDRLLATGVVALGELKISVADVDLIYIGLQLVVKSIETDRARDATVDDWPKPRHVARGGPPERMVTEAGRPRYESYGSSRSSPTLGGESGTDFRLSPRVDEPMLDEPTAPKPAGHGPDKGGGGLGKLVLTLVKLLHKLLKLQALRRMEAGTLSAAEMEGLGVTLMRQTQEIERMAKELGLQPDDLNLDLGPLGKLL
jgi:hypothetical protein